MGASMAGKERNFSCPLSNGERQLVRRIGVYTHTPVRARVRGSTPRASSGENSN